MAVGPGPDPLERATAALRAEDPPDWPPVSAQIKGRVSSLVRPSPVLLTVGPDGSPDRDGSGARTWVSGRVLVALVRERLRSSSSVPRDVDLDVVGDSCRSVRVQLVCAYGTDLVELGARVRDDVGAVLREVLGPDPERDPATEVAVEVVDVVVGDPRTT